MLIPVEDGVHGVVAYEHLWRFAALYQARVYGVRVIDPAAVESGLHETAEAQGLLEEDARQRLAEFETLCQTRGHRSKAELIIGNFVEEVVASSQKADFLIIGEAVSARGDKDRPRVEVVHQVLRKVAKPTLIARKGYEQLRRILVGYDGSEKGGHALQLAADMAERTSARLTVVAACETAQQGAPLVDWATAYLESYRLSWKPVLLETTPNEAITQTAHDEGADLVIIGSHGKSRLHELAFGSTTNHVLEYVRASILIYR
ncbi:MAG: universal stress protein [Candidatus Latescibacteria bacterium]|nr:universal stress protein [Candidatus Latescibacterota bacterium]